MDNTLGFYPFDVGSIPARQTKGKRMGQANKRGTKEQRIIEGERKATEKLAKERAARQAYLDSLTEEERAKIKKSRLLLATMLAFVDSTGLSNRIGRNF